MPPNAITLIKINLLGVTNNCAIHLFGLSGGDGITIICEFGINCVHVRERFDKPTVNESTKFGVRPKPNIVYGRCNEKYADCGN